MSFVEWKVPRRPQWWRPFRRWRFDQARAEQARRYTLALLSPPVRPVEDEDAVLAERRGRRALIREAMIRGRIRP